MRASNHHPDLHRWRAMGTECRAWFAGTGAAGAVRDAVALIAYLEARWSRFLPGSDITRANEAAGRPVEVAPETLAVVADAMRWWHATEGRFDPTVLAAMVAAGYDRDRSSGHGPITPGRPAPGCAGVEIDSRHGTLRLPRGTSIDLGGIGKGWAADLAADSLARLEGGLVDLGGDLRAWGRSPVPGGWPIAVDDPRDGSRAALLWLTEGAVVTSTTLRRRWSDGQREANHLVDPRTGSPVAGELVSVTVVAGRAAGAEVLAKAALVEGSIHGARALLERHGVDGLLVPATGPLVTTAGFHRFCWPEEGAVA